MLSAWPLNARFVVARRDSTEAVALFMDGESVPIPSHVTPYEGVANAVWLVPDQLLLPHGRYVLQIGSDRMIIGTLDQSDDTAPTLSDVQPADWTWCDSIAGRGLGFHVSDLSSLLVMDILVEGERNSAHLLVVTDHPWMSDRTIHTVSFGHSTVDSRVTGATYDPPLPCLGPRELGFGRPGERVRVTVRAIDGAGQASPPVVLDSVELLDPDRGVFGCSAGPLRRCGGVTVGILGIVALATAAARRRTRLRRRTVTPSR